MIVVPTQPRLMRRPSIVRHAGAALLVGLALAGCGKDPPATTAPAVRAPTGPTAQTAISNTVMALSPDQLRNAASQAYSENRLYAPAEDNAVEYYLALRDKVPGDPAASSALTDLLPMTVIAIEQSINREDYDEAQRLAALLERADKDHPALARLTTTITTQKATAAERAAQQQLTAEEEAKKKAELEKQRLEDQKKQQETAAKVLADREAADKRASDQRAASQREADQRAADQRAAAARATAAQPATQPDSTPARPAASAGELRLLSGPQPRYPPEALRAGQAGEVQVEFTVGTDGSVTAARVVRSSPPRVFDREAVNAIRRYKFQPVSSPVTTRRTVSFNPGT